MNAEKRDPAQKDQLLEDFRKSANHYIESYESTLNLGQHAHIFAGVSEPVKEVTLVSKVVFVCFTNNALALRQILEKIEKLDLDLKRALRDQLKKEVQKLIAEKFLFDGALIDILQRYNLMSLEKR